MKSQKLSFVKIVLSTGINMNSICNVLKENEPTNIKNDTLISLSSNLDSKLLRLFFFFFFFWNVDSF